ncbi:MAG: hypothetical protein L6R39_005604 [Caloplaca ligustica]|nr:MAG: hypothetical protein L6R39_005604 [Caloplaca ligustica]
MVSFLSQLNPTPGFPPYTGPYKVGSTNVEIPAAELPSPSPTPDSSISTVSFRIFYPSEPTAKHAKPIYWLPDPQQDYLNAYVRFLGASPRLSAFLRSRNLLHSDEVELLTLNDRNLPFLRILAYTTVPAVQNAKLLQAPTKNKRWPVMVFSHGLGGTKNAYSHLLGSLSSHGVVVIAPDHRDGSAPLSCIREKPGSAPRFVEYKSISHKQSPEVEQARDEQLRIRLWELGLIHEALLKIDRGEPLLNTLADTDTSALTTGHLAMFSSSLDVHTPGGISWSGHSFGAATIVQFIKSVFYRTAKTAPTSYQPLFQPSGSSQIAHQITPSSPAFLLDLWCLPLLSRSTRWLHDLPLPCYAPEGPGGRNLLAILSEAFFKWGNNLSELKRTVSEDPSLEIPANKSHPAPYIFYPESSAHLSQSDFGLLYPWFTKKAFKAQEPVRTLRLNTRAILEVLRRNGTDVADTSALDKEETGSPSHNPAGQLGQDAKILQQDGSVAGWVGLDLSQSERKEEAVNERTSENADPMDAVVQGEMTDTTTH